MLAVLKSWVEHALGSCRVCDQAPFQIFALHRAVQPSQQHCFSSAHPKRRAQLLSHVPLFTTPWTAAHQAPLSMEFSRQLEWVAVPFSRGIFPTQGSNPGLPHCRWILYQLSHQGSPRTLEWVGYPFSSESSQPRNWTGVSGIAGGFFTNWAIREALIAILIKLSQLYIFKVYNLIIR